MPIVVRLQPIHRNHGFTDAVGNTSDKCVTHAEGSMTIGHAGVGPALRESLELIELVGNKTTETTVGHSMTCLKRLAPVPPSPVRIVRLGLSMASGKLMAPSEYVYVKPVFLLVRSSRLLPLR